MLTHFIEPAVNGAHGFDCNTKLTAKSAAKLRNAGFSFALRYLTRVQKPANYDLDAEEIDTILDAGLALMTVQHVAKSGWKPSASLGKSYGENAVAHADSIGLAKGTTTFLDLEGVHSSVSAESVIEYCNTWQKTVGGAGYTPGIYVGANCGLTGQQLYWQLRMTHYWKSGSNVPDIPVRGYSMIQTIIVGDKVGGVEIDRNVIKTDAFGLTPIWMARKSVAKPQPLAAAPHIQSNDDAATLVALAATLGLSEPMQRLITYRDSHRPNSRPRYWAIVNFNLHSRNPRMFIFDAVANTHKEYLCAHGKGSEGTSDDGYASIFSNEDGSGCSSLGIYLCAETYHGIHGLSLRLDGLETTNSQARHRAIVIHGADYVSQAAITATGRIGRSLGCPAVENELAPEVVSNLANGSLFNVWSSN